VQIHRTTALVLALATSVVWGAEVVDPDDVAPGSRGVCVTEMDGGELVEIPLTVIGTVGPWTPEGEMVLVRLDDERFRHTGIIAGMSGSPVYVDGRLLGALAFGWPFAKEPIGGVTPFVRMQSLAEPSPTAAGAPARPTLVELMTAAREETLGETLSSWLLPQSSGGPTGLPVPVTASAGWAPAGGGWLADGFDRLGLVSVPGGASAETGSLPVEPGAMIAGVLVDGDAVVAAGGTVTEVRGERVWAFGHPFLGAGSVELPMARARVVSVLPSQASSFKFFTVGDAVGTLVSDRSRGILGRLGSPPDMIPLSVAVDDRRYEFRSVRHEALTPFLIAYVVQTSQAARGRVFGEQTIGVEVELRYRDREPAVYREVLASADAPVQAAALAAGVTAYLESSSFEPPELESVAVELTTAERLRAADMVSAVPDRRIVRPGEELPVRLRFQPHRGAVFEREELILVPPEMPDGALDLVVADGASWTLYELGMRPLVPASFADEIRLVNSLLPSSSVVLALERRQLGVTLRGGSVAVPPSVAVQLRTGLGPDLATTSHAVAKMEVVDLGTTVSGAVRIGLEVRTDQRVSRQEEP
jgi:hypothetical protein